MSGLTPYRTKPTERENAVPFATAITSFTNSPFAFSSRGSSNVRFQSNTGCSGVEPSNCTISSSASFWITEPVYERLLASRRAHGGGDHRAGGATRGRANGDGRLRPHQPGAHRRRTGLPGAFDRADR